MWVSIACFLNPSFAVNPVLIVIVEFLGEREVGKLVCGNRCAAMYCVDCIQVEHVVCGGDIVLFQESDESICNRIFCDVPLIERVYQGDRARCLTDHAANYGVSGIDVADIVRVVNSKRDEIVGD